MKNTERNTLIKMLQEKWPSLRATESENFNSDRVGGIWFRNTEMGYINGLPILDGCWPNEELQAFLCTQGWNAEPYDSCTLMAYED